MPFIRMMARSDFSDRGPDERYTMQSIVDRTWDGPLRAWCADAGSTAVPLLVDFGVEVNGEWFPWNGRWNGGGRTDGYGDPALADGPERFRDAYRHIVDLCLAQGAGNLTWFFHVDVGSYPEAEWNSDLATTTPATPTSTGSGSATTHSSSPASAGRASGAGWIAYRRGVAGPELTSEPAFEPR